MRCLGMILAILAVSSKVYPHTASTTGSVVFRIALHPRQKCHLRFRWNWELADKNQQQKQQREQQQGQQREQEQIQQQYQQQEEQQEERPEEQHQEQHEQQQGQQREQQQKLQ